MCTKRVGMIRMRIDRVGTVSIPKKSKNKQTFIDRVRYDRVRSDRVKNDRVRNDPVRNDRDRNDRGLKMIGSRLPDEF